MVRDPQWNSLPAINIITHYSFSNVEIISRVATLITRRWVFKAFGLTAIRFLTTWSAWRAIFDEIRTSVRWTIESLIFSTLHWLCCVTDSVVSSCACAILTMCWTNDDVSISFPGCLQNSVVINKVFFKILHLIFKETVAWLKVYMVNSSQTEPFLRSPFLAGIA